MTWSPCKSGMRWLKRSWLKIRLIYIKEIIANYDDWVSAFSPTFTWWNGFYARCCHRKRRVNTCWFDKNFYVNDVAMEQKIFLSFRNVTLFNRKNIFGALGCVRTTLNNKTNSKFTKTISQTMKKEIIDRPSYVLSGACNGWPDKANELPAVVPSGSSRFARRPCFELLWTNMLSDMANKGPSTPTWVEITT